MKSSFTEYVLRVLSGTRPDVQYLKISTKGPIFLPHHDIVMDIFSECCFSALYANYKVVNVRWKKNLGFLSKKSI